jgi:Spherulation-specific family 4/Secretion system C-terminal sorting domain
MYKTKLSISLVLLLFLFQTTGVTASSNKINKRASNEILRDSLGVNVLVPAYFDPSSSNYWDLLAEESAKYPGHIYAIANVYNGPGAQYEASYSIVINEMHKDSGKVIGYIHTSYGTRAINDVEADIDHWYSFYPSLDGIFIDEQANTSGKESYYSELYTYIKQKDSTALVVTNPGTNTLESYLFYNGKRIADVICIFESNTGFDSWIRSSWCSKYGSKNFYVLPYSTSSNQFVGRVNRAISSNVGWIYCTSDGGSNPWDTLPEYFKDFCSYVVTGTYSDSSSEHGVINIDGNFDDWTRIATLNNVDNPLDSTYSQDPDANYVNVWATSDSSNIYLSYQVAGDITSSYFYHIFIDTNDDLTNKTGFVYNDSASVGAEFMVENDGLWSYTGIGGDDWSWSSASGFQENGNDGRMELSIPLKVLFPNGSGDHIRIIFQTNQAASPYSLMDTAPNDYKTQYYTYNFNNVSDIAHSENQFNGFQLDQNYPNPFNPSTTISYEIPYNSLVRLTIYNVLGQEVETVIDKVQSPGQYKISLNFSNNAKMLTSGVYFYRFRAGDYVKTKKMILLK